jgi:beta-N-acetylhexosaminidase
VDWPVLDHIHLPPFRAAIAAGVAMVMSSHVCYPALGEPPGQPATFSKWLITQLLRQRMAFQGLILTDDMEMGALQAFGPMSELAVRAADAGHDLILVCSNLAHGEAAYAGLREAYHSGRLKVKDLQESAIRLEQVRERFSA